MIDPMKPFEDVDPELKKRVRERLKEIVGEDLEEAIKNNFEEIMAVFEENQQPKLNRRGRREAARKERRKK